MAGQVQPSGKDARLRLPTGPYMKRNIRSKMKALLPPLEGSIGCGPILYVYLRAY